MTTWTGIAIRDQYGALMVDNDHRVCIYETERDAREYGDEVLCGEPYTIYRLKFRHEWANG